jgi:DNA modification methylase
VSYYTDPLVTLLHGDCIEVMAGLEADSVDAVVTDPPYGLEFMGKEWDRFIDKRPAHNEKIAAHTANGRHGGGSNPFVTSRVTYRAGPAFQAWCEQWGREALRVTKPGGYLLAFGGTRTHHRLVCALEDAGWIIRDEITWIHAQGFPKSRNISKSERFCRCGDPTPEQLPAEPGALAVERDAQGGGVWPLCDRCGKSVVPAGWGTALKPAQEPIVLARKPLGSGSVEANFEKYGTGGLNIQAARIPGQWTTWRRSDGSINPSAGFGDEYVGASDRPEDVRNPESVAGRWPPNVALSDPELFDQPNPYVVGAGPNIGSIRPPVVAGKGQEGAKDIYGRGLGAKEIGEQYVGYGDSGGYSRFFRIPSNEGTAQASERPANDPIEEYPNTFIIPKADRAERERGLGDRPKQTVNITEGHGRGPVNTSKKSDDGIRVNHPRANLHPTVKPIDLMRHLVRLVTPPGGVVLDPFLGSGTTCLAASEEGFRSIGIERELEYLEIAKGRLMATPMGLGLDHGITGKALPKTHPDLSKHQPKRRAPGENYSGGWAGTDEEPAA